MGRIVGFMSSHHEEMALGPDGWMEKMEEFDTIKLALPEDDEEDDEDEDEEEDEEGGEGEGEEGEHEEVEAEEDKFKKEMGQKVKDKENNKVNNKHKRTGSLVNNGNVKKKRLTH